MNPPFWVKFSSKARRPPRSRMHSATLTSCGCCSSSTAQSSEQGPLPSSPSCQVTIYIIYLLYPSKGARQITPLRTPLLSSSAGCPRVKGSLPSLRSWHQSQDKSFLQEIKLACAWVRRGPAGMYNHSHKMYSHNTITIGCTIIPADPTLLHSRVGRQRARALITAPRC